MSRTSGSKVVFVEDEAQATRLREVLETRCTFHRDERNALRCDRRQPGEELRARAAGLHVHGELEPRRPEVRGAGLSDGGGLDRA